MAQQKHASNSGKKTGSREKSFFSLAYPASLDEYRLALEKLSTLQKYQPVTGSFSFEVVKWLALSFPDQTRIETSETDPESIRQFFRTILPRTEFESISSGDLSLSGRIRILTGKNQGSVVRWLTDQLTHSGLPAQVQETLFHNLRLFINWEVTPAIYRQLWLPAPELAPYIHRTLLRKPVLKKLSGKKLPQPTRLSGKKKKSLTDTARALLVSLHRETDPFTYADPDGITLFQLERGLSVALYSMVPARRLSIESYIGYLAFKNGVAVAYGGGWIFGKRCQFGINILPAFRGGESAQLFYQLLRVYRQHFRVDRFVVKPYQFGWHNSEALRSGAFWFYYKAGFRPADESLGNLAKKEWAKKKSVPGYRSPLAVLKKFTAADMVLDLSKRTESKPDAAKVSLQITEFINNRYAGNREKAIRASTSATKEQLGIRSLSDWNQTELHNFREWSLLSQAVLDIRSWPEKEKQKLVGLIRSRALPDERRFILKLQTATRFWKDLIILFPES